MKKYWLFLVNYSPLKWKQIEHNFYEYLTIWFFAGEGKSLRVLICDVFSWIFHKVLMSFKGFFLRRGCLVEEWSIFACWSQFAWSGRFELNDLNWVTFEELAVFRKVSQFFHFRCFWKQKDLCVGKIFLQFSIKNVILKIEKFKKSG